MIEYVQPTWSDIWKRLDQAEQHKATAAFTNWLCSLTGDKKKKLYTPFIRNLSKHMRFRLQSVKKMPARQMSVEIRKYIHTLFDNEDWQILFTEHYTNNKCEMMCRFLDLLDLEHDEHGMTHAEIIAPGNIAEITDKMTDEFGQNEIANYYSVLLLQDAEAWSFMMPSLQGFLALLAQDEVTSQVDHDAMPEHDDSTARDMSEDFTQLDRVLIDQVIATVADEARALTNSEIVDLMETIHALDTSRNRTYFHLGFVDSILQDREADFNRPEFNDERRGWYLAGLLAGVSRRRDSSLMRKYLKEKEAYFNNAINRPGGSGATMMRSIYPFLLDEGLLAEAISLLRAQAEAAVVLGIESTLQQAIKLLRSDNAVGASSLLGALCEALPRMKIDESYRVHTQTRINRRRGQAMQMQGNFDAAIKLFNELLANDAIHTAGLLADMGMVAGAFRQLSEIQVPESVNRRQVMHDSLKTGEHYFSEAAEKYGSDAPNAQYALAVLTYLECMNPEEKGSCTDSKRTKSLEYVNNALAGMTSSESLGAYEELGIIGRARFMQAVLMMGSCETSQTRKAMNAWREISAEAGMLPVWDIKALIESAELMEHHEYALEISESIWSHRQADALDIITSSKLLTESTVLRTGLLSLAREEKGAGEETWSHWTLLIPAFLKKNEIDLAEEGLDRLEGIAVNGRFSEKMLEWLELPEHYDPAWSEEEALRARFRLLRRLGRDADAFDQLRQLFFMLRDQRFEEASQVHALFKEYGANEDFYTDLVLQTPDEGSSVVEPQLLDRLREGEKMRVLFIGGNEIQARYDESVMQSLTSEWPGMHVQFEHTGWSSNWGKEVDRLKRLAIQSDAVVLMTMMRTTLGRTMRAALNDPPRPWIPCTGTGRQAVHNSIRKAAIVALKLKER